MIKQSQKLLLSKEKNQALQVVSLLRQAACYQSTATGNAGPSRFQLNYKPAPLQAKLWKNALEVRSFT
jgi:hypothetical protein